MPKGKLRDNEAKKILLSWPTNSKKLVPVSVGSSSWIQGQPKPGIGIGPRLMAPGTTAFKTQPDGLYVSFQQTTSCDVLCIEVCGTDQNLNDKRSRYFPASHSIVLSVKTAWLSEDIVVQKGGTKARSSVAGIKTPLQGDVVQIPIRHLRVVYALPNELYKKWSKDHTPTGYEFFCPHSALASYTSQKMQAFLKRTSITAHFYLKK